MQPRALRITTWWGKLLYVFGAWFVAGRLLWWMFASIGTPQSNSLVILVPFDLALLVVGARIFRGSGEPVAPPRPWWKMTARRKLSTVLGIIFAVSAAWLTLWLVLSFALGRAVHNSIAEIVSTFVYVLVPAFLYLNSAARLKSEPKPDDFSTAIRF